MPVSLPTTGDLVIAVVTYITNSNIMCSVIARENQKLPHSLQGVIRDSDMTNIPEYKSAARPNELFKVGGYVLARVLTASERILMLSTAEDNLGQIDEERLFQKLNGIEAAEADENESRPN